MTMAHVEAPIPKLGSLEKLSLLRGVRDPEYFKSRVKNEKPRDQDTRTERNSFRHSSRNGQEWGGV
jgi:hypothetical protein